MGALPPFSFYEDMENVVITFNDGSSRHIPSFIPKLEGELAIVHLDVVQRLAAILGREVSFQGIKLDFKNEVSDAHTMEDLLAVAKEFVAFHETINLIRTYKVPEEPVEGDYATSPEEDPEERGWV